MRFSIVILWFFAISAWGSIYKELRIDPSVSQEEIKKEHRRMAQTYHPDKYPEGSDEQRAAEATFKKKDEAFRILLDPEQKKKHDDWIDSPEYEEWKSAKGDEGAVSGFNSSSFNSGISQSGFDWRSAVKKGGGTDLHRAIEVSERFWYERDVLKMVKSIVETGVDVNAVNKDGETALYMAIQKMYAGVVRYLFTVGASPRMPKENEIYRVVMRAVRYSHIGESVWNSDRGSLYNEYHRKKEKRALGMFSLLRKHGMNLHLREPLPEEELPLELAVSWGYEKVVLWIIEQEGIEYLTDEERDHIVHLAIKGGQSKVVISLIRKLSGDGRSWEGGTNALSYAMTATPYFGGVVHSIDNELFALKMVKAIVRTGVDVNAEDNYGETALSMAISQRYIRVVKYLFRVGASPDIPRADEIFSDIMHSYVFVGNGVNDKPEMRKVKRALRMFVLLREHNVNLDLSKPLPFRGVSIGASC